MEENNNAEQPQELNAWEKYKLENDQPSTNVEAVAQENNVEASVSEVPESSDAITTADLSASSSDTVQAVGSIENGVIGVAVTPRPAKQAVNASPTKSKKTVAIYSTKNVSWSSVGKVYRGYNIVTPEQSEKWLTRSHVRLATPEEVAKEFGN
jgi:galactitol-specific phosphotransferase system IIB component